MPDIRIRIKKKPDGSAALSCVREDGTITWQRQDGQQGRFFPLHDLTHYAVETVLDLRGFYSLVAEGWDVSDFGRPWARGPLPAEALVVEMIVGFLDTERASGETWSAADLASAVTTRHRQQGSPPPATPSDLDLAAVREARRHLFARWAATPAGETLELHFAPGEETGSRSSSDRS